MMIRTNRMEHVRIMIVLGPGHRLLNGYFFRIRSFLTFPHKSITAGHTCKRLVIAFCFKSLLRKLYRNKRIF
jgi:hypothetical protein